VTLADRVDAVHAEFRRRSALALGGEVSGEDGLLLWAGPNSIPAVVNGVIRTATGLRGAEVLAHADKWFGERQRGYTVFCRSDTDRDVVGVCEERGLAHVADGGLPELVIHRAVAVPPLVPGVSVREVTTTRDRDDYRSVFAASYAQLGAPEQLVDGVMPPLEMLQGDDVGAFVVDLDDKPAAVAMSVLIDGVADVHWVGTMPWAGRRGLGEIATAMALAYGFEGGADVAALQASPMGDGLYRRMGFVELYRYNEFLVLAA
jgi:hypothetical protein